MFTQMKSFRLIAAVVILCCGLLHAEDVYLNDGLSYQFNGLVDGSLYIENANVALYTPAHITGFAVTGSGAILDIFGGQIDYMLLVSTSDNGLPDGIVTIYGSNFAVDGIPVTPDTAELFLSNQTVSGLYEDGTPFSMVVDCAISGNANYLHYQTLKLGWIVARPQIHVSQLDYSFEQTQIGDTIYGVVSVYNLGKANLTIQSISVVQDEPVQFGFTGVQVIPMTLEPNSVVDIEVFFAPVLAGESEATLQIASSDPDVALLAIRLTGTGAAAQLMPQELAQDALDFLQEGLAAGTITGDGKGKSASNNARVFGKMLNAAKELINAQYDAYALEALGVLEKKCDGKKAPADFIKGNDVPALHTMIVDLMLELQGS